MAIYSCKYVGFRFYITPEKSVKFNDGRLTTDDPEAIAKLDAYAENHKEELNRIDAGLQVVDEVRDAIREKNIQPSKMNKIEINDKPESKKADIRSRKQNKPGSRKKK